MAENKTQEEIQEMSELELVEWLSERLPGRSAMLDDIRRAVFDNYVDGIAFLELNRSDWQEFGLKIGPAVCLSRCASLAKEQSGPREEDLESDVAENSRSPPAPRGRRKVLQLPNGAKQCGQMRSDVLPTSAQVFLVAGNEKKGTVSGHAALKVLGFKDAAEAMTINNRIVREACARHFPECMSTKFSRVKSALAKREKIVDELIQLLLPVPFPAFRKSYKPPRRWIATRIAQVNTGKRVQLRKATNAAEKQGNVEVLCISDDSEVESSSSCSFNSRKRVKSCCKLCLRFA